MVPIKVSSQHNMAPADNLAASYDASRVGPTGRRFDLLRSFALLSFVVVFTIGAFSAAFISAFLTENLLERDAVDAQQFLQRIIVAKGGIDLFLHPADDAVYPGELNYIAAMPDVVRANFYSAEGRVIWSTNPVLVGKRFDPNQELERALQGQVIFDVKELNKAEHVQFEGHSRAVENYLPIRDAEQRRVVGVVEIYKSPADLFATIEDAHRLVWLGAVLAGLFLYLSLFWIVYRANKLIHHQQEKLVEAETMAAVGEMASAVAHSIRNPLAAIRSSAELALETSNDRATREMSEDVISEADRLEHWVRELLMFSRPGTGVLQPVQLDQVLAGCLADFGRSRERQRIRLETDFAPHLPEIRGDTGLLAQMFNSLIANAIEAMPDGGTLRVAGAMAEDGRGIRISIADTGYGIPPERLDRIFEMRTTTKRGGLGIGMLLVRRIVERHGGSIQLASESGKGTLVCLQFATESKP